MAQYHVIKFSAIIAGSMLLGLASVAPSGAACLINNSGRTLFLTMQSDQGKIERSFTGGDRVCQNVAEKSPVSVNVLPYGGARFGCRLDLIGGEERSLEAFNTMNKCKFR